MEALAWLRSHMSEAVGLIFPAFARPRHHLGKIGWLIHFAIVALILVGLGFLNYALELEKLLETPLPFLRKVWLPLLFFIVYLLTWLGCWLWVLLGAEEERSVHPDIDRAWAVAVAELEGAGIHLPEVPVFLVLGQPEGTEQALFAGSQLELTLEHIPPDSDAPLRVYASPDAVFVTCAGASLLGQQAQVLLEDEPPPPPRVERAASSGDPTGTDPSINLPAVKQGDSISAEHGAASQMTIGAEVMVAERPAGLKQQPVRVPLLKRTEEVDRLLGRLKRVCYLILSRRRPYCPINGILVLIPYAATRNDADANQTGLICQRDLVAAREVLQVNCPLFALVCDMENATGFREFIDRFPKGHRQRRLGQQFPYVADLNPTVGGQLIDGGVQWICQELFPPLVYRLMRLEKAGGPDKVSSTLRGNMNLYQLLCEVRERRRRLARILSLTIAAETNEAILFGGCYLAATGRSTREQAFIAAVFHRLLENQNFVSWTAGAREEETDYRRWVRYGYTALVTFTVSLFAMGFAFISKR